MTRFGVQTRKNRQHTTKWTFRHPTKWIKNYEFDSLANIGDRNGALERCINLAVDGWRLLLYSLRSCILFSHCDYTKSACVFYFSNVSVRLSCVLSFTAKNLAIIRKTESHWTEGNSCSHQLKSKTRSEYLRVGIEMRPGRLEHFALRSYTWFFGILQPMVKKDASVVRRWLWGNNGGSRAKCFTTISNKHLWNRKNESDRTYPR